MKKTHNYASLLALATKYKNFKRGKKFHSYYVRLKPGDDTAVELGYWYTGYHASLLGEPPSQRYRSAKFDKKDQPFVTLITMYPDHALITNERQYAQVPPELPPELLKKYPDYDVKRGGPYVYADIGLNNLLGWAGLPLDHTGTRDKHPGMSWVVLEPDQGAYRARTMNPKTKIWGPVRYDYASRTVSAVLPQPERVVKTALRRQISTQLRAAFKKLRMFSRLGVVFSESEYRALLTPEGDLARYPANSKGEFPSVAFEARVSDYSNPDALLKCLETTDFTERTQIVELAVRCACALQPNGSYYLGPSTHYATNLLHSRLGPTGMVDDESTLARLRKVLHDANDVVRYEM